MSKEKMNIALGSGAIYEMEFTGEIPEDSAIETEENRLGYIKKGATLEYKPTMGTIKDDLGCVFRTFLTEEEAGLKFALVAWSAQKLKSLCSTARITQDTNNEKRTVVKIGGNTNFDGKQHLFRFTHKDKIAGDVRITIVGTNTGGFSLAYTEEDAANVEVEVTAVPHDGEGTLILIYVDDQNAAPAPAVYGGEEV